MVSHIPVTVKTGQHIETDPVPPRVLVFPIVDTPLIVPDVYEQPQIPTWIAVNGR